MKSNKKELKFNLIKSLKEISSWTEKEKGLDIVWNNILKIQSKANHLPIKALKHLRSSPGLHQWPNKLIKIPKYTKLWHSHLLHSNQGQNKTSLI